MLLISISVGGRFKLKQLNSINSSTKLKKGRGVVIVHTYTHIHGGILLRVWPAAVKHVQTCYKHATNE